jgi:hypothetical protein
MALTKSMLLEAAEGNRSAGRDAPDQVQQLIREHDLVFCVWRNPDALQGVEHIFLKGRRKMQAARSFDAPVGTVPFKRRPGVTRWTAVLFDSADAARQFWDLFGEGIE